MKIGSIEIDIGSYVQKRFIGARFIIALFVIIGYLQGCVDSDTAKLILVFYFASHVDMSKKV